jgi:hypothetical protein
VLAAADEHMLQPTYQGGRMQHNVLVLAVQFLHFALATLVGLQV